MIVGIPVIQLVLFGFAINSDPKHLPTMLLDADRSEFSRSIVSALANSDYFAFVGEAAGEDDATARSPRVARSSSSRSRPAFRAR
jgi:ABC-2 type transport system permease protein